MIAASNEKTGRPVPTTEATVKLTDPNKSAKAFARQARDVADVHPDVMQAPRSPPPPCSIPTVAVGRVAAKLRPAIVSKAYPVSGVFSRKSDTTAASKLYPVLPVPDTDATVTLAHLKRSPKAVERHTKVVEDVQDDVKHTPKSPLPPRSNADVAV